MLKSIRMDIQPPAQDCSRHGQKISIGIPAKRPAGILTTSPGSLEGQRHLTTECESI